MACGSDIADTYTGGNAGRDSDPTEATRTIERIGLADSSFQSPYTGCTFTTTCESSGWWVDRVVADGTDRSALLPEKAEQLQREVMTYSLDWVTLTREDKKLTIKVAEDPDRSMENGASREMIITLRADKCSSAIRVAQAKYGTVGWAETHKLAPSAAVWSAEGGVVEFEADAPMLSLGCITTDDGYRLPDDADRSRWNSTGSIDQTFGYVSIHIEGKGRKGRIKVEPNATGKERKFTIAIPFSLDFSAHFYGTQQP